MVAIIRLFARASLVAAAFGLLLSQAAYAQRRPITEKDLFSFVWVADPQISPDGSQVAFVRVTVDEKKDCVRHGHLARQADGSEPPRALTSGIRDTSPRWSPDGRRLAFVAIRREGRPAAAGADLSHGDGAAASRGRSPTSRAAPATLSGRPTADASPSRRRHSPTI